VTAARTENNHGWRTNDHTLSAVSAIA
jgi:hypothetical protein